MSSVTNLRLTNCTDFIANSDWPKKKQLSSVSLSTWLSFSGSFNPGRTHLTTSFSMDAAPLASKVKASSTIGCFPYPSLSLSLYLNLVEFSVECVAFCVVAEFVVVLVDMVVGWLNCVSDWSWCVFIGGILNFD